MVTNDRGTHSAAPESRRERNRRELRDRLYQAAVALFRVRGYEGTSVQDIADAADTAKATFFNYFPTKEHVLAEYHARMAADILAVVEGQRHPTAEEAVQRVLAECADYALDDPAIARAVLRVIFVSDVLLEADRDSEERLQRHLHDILAAGVASGELRDDLDLGLFQSLLVGTLSATVTEWVTGDAAFDLKGRLRAKVRLLFRAARSDGRHHGAAETT